MRHLVTFGDSWVYGVGAGYRKELNSTQYEQIRFVKTLCDSNSFRTFLSDFYQADNLNFASQGSSNQRQFRLASEFLESNNKRLDNHLVLWGVTSLYRNEIWDEKTKSWFNFQYADKKIGKEYLMSFDHTKEIKKLVEKIKEMINKFKMLGANIYFYDIFNHNDYMEHWNDISEYFLFGQYPKRDLLSILSGEYDTKHFFQSNLDDNYADPRVRTGIYKEFLNPYSWHPTRKGHETISKLLVEELNDKNFNFNT